MSAKQKIRPMGSRVLVEREEARKMKGGILLPESAQEKPKAGTVVAVGPGRVNEKGQVSPLDVKVGDRVLFSSYGGTEYKIDDTDVLIVSEEDLLAVYSK